ncbi:unnamed protein product [Clonostachys byssicola]|uniref:Uncharacterized protein n=1 Tax=Clonostachys byssicola TaxID=160290 RepID=A0A9N9Y5T9_9HYPO|nr:unnamed protein product [Clonostachys byssicola]
MNKLGAILTRRRLNTAVGAAFVTGIGGWGTFWFSTRHATFRPLPDHDSLVQSHFHQAFNPHKNQALSDIYSSTIRVEDLDPKLVDDFRNGGSKLIERYSQGIFGRWAFAIQRQLVQSFSSAQPPPGVKDVTSTKEILNDEFNLGTLISKEFFVLQKSPRSIILRGGEPNPSNKDGLRKLDVLSEIEITTNDDKTEITFAFKNMFFSGEGMASPPPLPEFMTPLHLMYAKALAANGATNCMRK